ncbi:hypothetical protein FQR65_LT04890 [Abscondita terminalis]|nr:hypothetical protein FQR65_LT04890 [Abscondita terminalis]
MLSASSAVKIEDHHVKVCVDNIIQNNFREQETLFFLKLDYDNSSFVEGTNHPYMIVNLMKNVTKFATYKNYKPVIVIHSSFYNIGNFLISFQKSGLWNHFNFIKATYIVVTTTFQNVPSLFRVYWILGIVNVVVISYNNYNVSVYTSDPQAAGNQCGNRASIVNEQKCTPEIRVQLPKLLRKFTNCRITHVRPLNDTFVLNRDVINVIVIMITTHLNATLIKTQNAPEFNNFLLLPSIFKEIPLTYTSPIVEYQDFAWVVPAPRTLHPIEVLKVVFQNTVWLAILLSYLVTSIICKIRNKLVILNPERFRNMIHDNETYTKFSYVFKNDEVSLLQAIIGPKIYKFVDNSITSSYKETLITPYTSYYAETFFKLLLTFVETGLRDYLVKKIEFKQEFYRNILRKEDVDTIVLNLDHLMFPFLFWIVCVLFATIVFIVEKYVKF